MAKVQLREVSKSYAGSEVIHGIDAEVADGEFIVIVGPSGCGKSTLLRMVAGLEEITSGEIVIGDRVVNALEPKDRDIAMVFQNYALYPHMSVFDNMAYGLKIRGLPKSDIDARVKRAAQILELGPLLERKPRQLSGGQRQRVAMTLDHGGALRPTNGKIEVGQSITVGIRPEHLRPANDGYAALTGSVEMVEQLGADTLVHIGHGSELVIARLPHGVQPQIGSQ